jgi:HD-GYP domain-containing protein (c-di-GMP phosphodiesterase class II)
MPVWAFSHGLARRFNMTLWARIRPGLLSIRAKLTLPYILLAVLIAVGGGWIVSEVALNSLDERFKNQLIETRKLASDSMVREENDLLGTLRLIAHTQGLADGLRRGDRQKIVELVYPVTFNAGDDAVLLLDAHGEPIVALIRSDATGQYEFPSISNNLTDMAFVSNVLDQKVDVRGDKYSGISRAAWGDYFFVCGPVKDAAGQFVGAVLVGESLDSLVRQIREETLSQATIYDLTLHPVTSSFEDTPPAPQTPLATVLAADDVHGPLRDLQVRNIDYTELISPWKARGDQEIGVLGTALPQAFLVRTSRITRFNITAITILAILLATLLGVSLSGTITRPILKLKRAATQLSRGNLGVRVDVEGGDEVAVLAQSFNTMVADLSRSKKDLVAAYDKTIEGWSRALELRDPATMGHTKRASEMSLELGRAMHLDGPLLDDIRRGALLHDIGKMGVPDSILYKTGELSSEEREIMKRHPLYAREMLNQIGFLFTAMDIPVFHHERWNGTGYPYGLAGKMIPLTARIFAVLDVWDALTSDRPYRQAWQEQEAREYICDNSGTLFDPEVVSAFQGMYEVLLAIKKGL